MHYLARMPDPEDFPDTRPLIEELDRWSDANATLDVWWRDDDVTAPSLFLDRLLVAAQRVDAPLALAAIPAALEELLVPRLDHPLVTVLQHGYCHGNFAAPGGRAVESGGDRPVEAVVESLAAGQERLATVFGGRFVPVMVPPWNRIEPDVTSRLAELGYRALSVFGEIGGGEGRNEARLPQINAHLDLLTWKGGARFAGRAKLIGLAIERIAMRRRDADRAIGGPQPYRPEPFGLLTHHLDHDEDTWDFLDEFLALLSAHPAVRLASIRELLP